MFLNTSRLILRMKKLVLLSVVLFGTVVASQAGVQLNIGFGFPFIRSERVIVTHPAPVYVERVPVCAPAPVYVAPPRCYAAPRVIYAPPRYYSYPSQHSYHHDHGRPNRHHR